MFRYTYEYDDFVILPITYNGSLSHEEVTIRFCAATTEDEYRCREVDDSRTTREVVDADGYPCYQDLSSRDMWSQQFIGGKREMSDIIPKHIGEIICNKFFARCDDGKYPDVFIYMDKEYYEEVKFDLDTDRGRGELYAEYRMRINLRGDDESSEDVI
jgi:hypothetical protein